MKPDIENRDDIQLLVDAFYAKVRTDEIIGYLFNDVAKVNWATHLPRMYEFWENVLFQTGNFSGNPMVAHYQLHQKSPLTAGHFSQWQKLFLATVDEFFEGEKAELAKQRALSISAMIQWKVIAGGDKGPLSP